MTGGRPSGTVTFLFTDIEGSTRLWGEHPVEMRAALVRHDEILRTTIDQHRGYVFATGGDGFAAAFHVPDDAVGAAVECQAKLAMEPFAGGLDIRVRIGIDLGTADERGGDYFGPVVNQAARIMSAAHGGQVLASATAARLIDGGHHVADLGVHRLAGVVEPLTLVQVNQSAAPSRFPPLRTEHETPGNVVRPSSAFVGRAAEIGDLGERLVDHRLVTVIGVGGTGKTRLAVEAAHTLRGRYPDGVWIAELADIADGAGVAGYVASVLGLRPDPGVAVLTQVVDWLRGSESLLILDNCEHVVGGASSFAHAVARSCSGVRLVATSREPLFVDGEDVFALGSLSVDPIEGNVAPAIELFESRVAAERGAWTPAPEVRAEVEQLCRRLDGIPLAIELAAARARTMSVGDVLDRLDRRFRLLTGGRRSTVERHKTLHATVDWSYQLLSPADQLVFDRLSVFNGRFGIAEATAVCQDDQIDELGVVDGLADLVDKSMVEAQPDVRGGEYRLLETMRAFGVENCGHRGEMEVLRDRHAAHYVRLAVELQQDLIGPEELEVRRRAQLASADLRGALDWVAIAQDLPALASLSRSLIWFIYCGWMDPARWIDSIVDDLNAAVAGFAESAAFACLILDGDPTRATRRLDRLGDRDTLELDHHGLFALVVSSILAGEPQRGREPAEQMLASGDVSANPAERAFSAFGLANVKAILGEPDEELAMHFLRAAEAEGSATARSYALSTGARMFLASDQDRAVRMLEEARDLAVSVDSRDALGNALNGLLSPNIDRLPLREAALEASQALETAGQIGNAAVQRSILGLAQIVLERIQRFDLAALVNGHLADRRQPVSPDEQARYDNSVRLLHSALDSETLHELRSRGAAQSTRDIAKQTASALRVGPV